MRPEPSEELSWRAILVKVSRPQLPNRLPAPFGGDGLYGEACNGLLRLQPLKGMKTGHK